MKRVFLITIAFVLLISLCAVGFSSCRSRSLYSEGDGSLDVVVTIFPPFDLAREVGGDRVTVTLLQDNGTDLHNYTPTSATLDALSSADVFIFIGGTSDELWVDNAIKACGNDSLITLCLMDYVSPIHAELENDWSGHDHDEHGDKGNHEDGGEQDGEGEHGDGHSHDGHEHLGDEHIWTSPKNAILMVDAIRSAFALADPQNASYYADRASAYTAQLSELDAILTDSFSSGGLQSVVFADRFPFVYLFHDYHIPYVAAFSGCSTEANASFDTQMRLIKALEGRSQKFVLTIEGDDKPYAKALSAELNAAVFVLDSMQSIDRADIEGGVTYLSIMRKNIEVLREVLS